MLRPILNSTNDFLNLRELVGTVVFSSIDRLPPNILLA